MTAIFGSDNGRTVEGNIVKAYRAAPVATFKRDGDFMAEDDAGIVHGPAMVEDSTRWATVLRVSTRRGDWMVTVAH